MDLAVVRDDMVDSLEHEAKGVVRSDAVAEAMRAVPRHLFVEDDRGAYADTAHEVAGTRVLAPSTVARLVETLDPNPDDDVLIVGAGVGYTAAVFAELVDERNVHAVDIDRGIVLEARRNLARADYEGVLVDCRDGARGLPEYAPFDRVLVEAAAVRPPGALVEQLADGGRLVMPIGVQKQTLTVIDEAGETVDRLGNIVFAPLLVDGEQASAIERNRSDREEQERARRSADRRHGWQYDWIDWDG
ncbi:MAG: protein-L-isoaspartate(D-aspartate) O-methyltransferase [Natrialbaceae archaeon]|jgi:protein-L-isoaspartate(D-aspartate) O-methyltransferase